MSRDDDQASGVITPEQAATLRTTIRDHANIKVAGGTGSGKTTLANALLHEIAQLGERVVLLEDTRELQCAAEDVVAAWFVTRRHLRCLCGKSWGPNADNLVRILISREPELSCPGTSSHSAAWCLLGSSAPRVRGRLRIPTTSATDYEVSSTGVERPSGG